MPTREEFTEEFAVDVFDVEPEPQPRHAEPPRPNGDIVVTVDEAAVVREVTVAPDWRSRMRPHQLAPALLEAANTAVAKRREEHWRDFEFAAEVRESPAVPGYRDPAGLTEEILDLIERVPREQEELLNRARAAVSAETRTEGLVTVVLTGRQITAVDVDENWARIARYTEIGVEATKAFQAAQRKAPPLAENTIDLPPAMARLRELTADPAALARQLGLTY